MPEVASDLNHCVVEDMQDGGMGSIRFLTNRQTDRTFGKTMAEATYTDEDGVIVSITLNVDTSGYLYELDFWKTDFSRLRRYPTCADLTQRE